MSPKTLNVLKWLAAAVVASAGGLLAAAHSGSLTLPSPWDQVLAGIVAVGSALGIVSSGAHKLPPPEEPKP